MLRGDYQSLAEQVSCSDDDSGSIQIRSTAEMVGDPLYHFNAQILTTSYRTASASKLRRIQGSQALDRNEDNSRTAELTDADRAIRTVWEKLKSDLSVEYNVNE